MLRCKNFSQMILYIDLCYKRVGMSFIVKNLNIQFISWQSVLLMEETGVPGENHWPAVSYRHELCHVMLYLVHLTSFGFEFTTMLVVIGTDCIGSYKSNYHSINRNLKQWGKFIFMNNSLMFLQELINLVNVEWHTTSLQWTQHHHKQDWLKLDLIIIW